MTFLEELDFTKDEIEELYDTVPEKILKLLVTQKKLVTENIKFLKNLGITNYKDIFLKYYDIFLMDNSNFQDIFNKYETDDLISKLNNNIKIVEYL